MSTTAYATARDLRGEPALDLPAKAILDRAPRLSRIGKLIS